MAHALIIDGQICGLFNLAQPGNPGVVEVADDDPRIATFLDPPKPQLVLSQDLMAQFTAIDAAAIRTAVEGNAQFWLLWSALQAQKDAMDVGNARFLQGWSALVTVLGQQRMTEIANVLNVVIG